MSSITVIENKISAILRYIGFLKGYRSRSLREVENNIMLRGAVERYLYLAIQATLDLSEAIIAYKNLPKPSTYSESFDILNEANIITKKSAEKLRRMAGFRNVIAHDYEQLDF